MADNAEERRTRSDNQQKAVDSPAKRQRVSAFDAGTFTLVSSDGTAFPVNAVVLAGNCKVFFDMLETGEGEGKSCKLSESKEDVEEFLKVLSDETWEPRTWMMWEAMAKMADKYDSPRHRMALRYMARCARRSDSANSSILTPGSRQVMQSLPYNAYAAGCILQDIELARTAVHRSHRHTSIVQVCAVFRLVKHPDRKSGQYKLTFC